MKVMKSGQDDKIKRILVACVILILVCIVCILVSIRFVGKYRNKAAEAVSLKQELEDLEQEVKKLDVKTKELEATRYDLSLEKGQISKDYSAIKDKYVSLGKMIKALERDVNNLQKVLKIAGDNEVDPEIDDKDSDGNESQLRELQNRNDELLKELAATTKEKMILRIALESQAKRLGLTEQYDPELKEILKDLVTSLQ
jgi:chromosome segregation ATPase